MASAKKPTTKKSAAKKPAVKKTPASKKATSKSSILSYSRPKEFNTDSNLPSAPPVPTENVITNPAVPTASPEVDKPTLPVEQLTPGETGLVSAPPEITEPTSPLAAAQTTIDENTSEEPADVIAGEPLLPTVAAPGEPAAASSIALPPSITKIQRRRRIRRLLAVSAGLLLIAAAGYWFLVNRGQDIQTADRQLIAEVSKLTVVPESETPSITTVVDENKVNQEFLRSAKKGDKVLLYFQAGRAIVYRPSSHQIVNMGPLQAPKPRVFLRNGATQDAVPRVANVLNQSAEFLVASRDDSPKKSYVKTIVVDLAGNRPDVAERLAKQLGATVAPLPEGESRPDADLLVLVGSDYGKQ